MALFPIRIKATSTASANVFFHRPLGFVVTPKTRQDGGNQWVLWDIGLMSILMPAVRFRSSEAEERTSH